MSQALATIVQLQAALDNLGRTEGELAGVPAWMEELHARHGARLAEIRAFEEAADEASSTRRRAERSSQEAEGRLKHYQEQISLVRTQREYSALLQEIDTVKAEIKGLEDEALEAIEAYDEARSQHEEQLGEFDSLDTEYRDAQEKWEEEKPSVAHRADMLRREIAELETALPRPMLALFQRILDRHAGEATAPVGKATGPAADGLWHCTSCNYLVRLQVVAEIRRGQIHQCDACKRVLYVEEDQG